MSVRPPARDAPTEGETAELVAGLRRAVDDASDRSEDLATSQPPVRAPGDRSRMVLVRIDGGTARLTLRHHGQRLARRELPVSQLVEHLEHRGQTYDALAGLLDDHNT